MPPHRVHLAWAAVIDKFVWDGKGSLMHWSTPALVSTIYLAICAAHSLRRTKPPLASARTLDTVTALHNVLLAAFSAVACAAGTYYLAAHLSKNGGLHPFLCPPVPSEPSLTPPPLSGPLHGWCYIFYLSKYWELVDTLLLISRGKRVVFLHAFHHALLPPLMAALFHGRVSVSLVGLTVLNPPFL